MSTERKREIGRRSFLLAAGSVAALPLLGCEMRSATGSPASASVGSEVVGRRRLGKLEVSSVGMGVQNMSRKYTTEVPYRRGIEVRGQRLPDAVLVFSGVEAPPKKS